MSAPAPAVGAGDQEEPPTPGDAAAPAAPRRVEARTVGWVVLAALVFLSLLQVPRGKATVEIDPSWLQALPVVHEQGLRLGVDYVWTYGPLAYTISSYFDDERFWSALGWQLGYAGALTLLLALAGRDLETRWQRVCLLVGALLLLRWSRELRLLLLVVLPCVWALDARRRGPWPAVAVAGWLGVLALNKFTFLLLGGVGLPLLVVRGWRSWGPRALGLLPVAALTHCLGWTLLGQRLSDWPEYLRWGLELSSYYSAMSRDGAGWHVLVAAAVIALLAGAALSEVRARRWDRLPQLLFLGACVALSWKQAFIRQDTPHEILFFGLWACVAPALLGPDAARGPALPRRLVLAAWGLALLVALSLYSLSHLATRAWRPFYWTLEDLLWLEQTLERERRQEAELRAHHALPAIRARVGRETVDALTVCTGLVLLHDLEWRPRPTLQSYLAHSPAMAALNVAHFTGPRAPEHVLCLWVPIDGRLPTLEDGPALLELLRRYDLSAGEGPGQPFLISRRATPRSLEPPRPLGELEVDLGRPFDLSAFGVGPRCLEVEVELSSAGRLRRSLLRAPRIDIEVITAERARSFRLVPEMARSLFLIDPLPATQDDLHRLFAGALEPGGILGLRLVPAPGLEWAFAPRARVRVYEPSGLPGPGR